MAFFKFRQGGQPPSASRGAADEPAPSSPAETIDTLRRRARHRLIGAAVLVAVAVVAFPLLFDTQPRPVAVDVPIIIPDRDKAAPLTIPEPAPRGNAVATTASLGDKEEVLPPAGAARPAAATPSRPAAVADKPAPPRAAVPEATPKPAEPTRSAAPEPPSADARAQADEAAARARREEAARLKKEKDEAAALAKREAAARARKEAADRAQRDEAARARALLEGRSPDRPAPPAADKPAPAAAATPAATGARFIVQVGAFADAAKAREVRQQAERAGVKTYTQAVETKDGPRTRVRGGPYASREEADKAAGALKRAGLTASILSL